MPGACPQYCSSHEYNCLFSSMLASWRAVWAQPSVPVAFVQLGPYGCAGNVSTIRLAQSDTLPADQSYWTNHSARIPTPLSAAVPTYDLGSPQPGHVQDPQAPGYNLWIHQRNKSAVARRLALALMRLQPPDLPPITEAAAAEQTEGPRVGAARVVLGAGKMPTVEITLDRAEGVSLAPAQGCVRCCDQSVDPEARADAGSLFEVANRRGKWLPATGELDAQGKLVVRPRSTVSGGWVSAVRYAVVDEPQCVLYGPSGLPALPFELPLPWKANQ